MNASGVAVSALTMKVMYGPPEIVESARVGTTTEYSGSNRAGTNTTKSHHEVVVGNADVPPSRIEAVEGSQSGDRDVSGRVLPGVPSK